MLQTEDLTVDKLLLQARYRHEYNADSERPDYLQW